MVHITPRDEAGASFPGAIHGTAPLGLTLMVAMHMVAMAAVPEGYGFVVMPGRERGTSASPLTAIANKPCVPRGTH
jgi:hypothetical protein